MYKKLIGIMVAMLLAVNLLVTAYSVPLTEPAGVPVVEADNAVNRNVIFFHPDGYGLSHWNVLRFWLVGPDGRLNWDKLPHIAPYTEHMRNTLTASSHGGATVHAYGVKVVRDSFGLDEHTVITALSGRQMSIMEEAIEAGFATALVQTGSLVEPGTAVFVASVEERHMREEIAKQVIKSGVDVILGGGEAWLLPEGVTGRHGTGRRTDGLNLIEQAKVLGYTVVYTREELMKITDTVTSVLGVFASGDTFRAQGLPHFLPEAPTIAEMSAAALEFLSRNPKAAAKGIFIVAEEEGTDNFGNNSNASGSFESGKRADEAFGVFVDFVEQNPNTLLITAADSSAGTKGIRGAGTAAPFLSAPDRAGKRHPFVVTWVSGDVSGGVVARALGFNAELVTELRVIDNTDIYRIMYYTLFGKWLPAFP